MSQRCRLINEPDIDQTFTLNARRRFLLFCGGWWGVVFFFVCVAVVVVIDLIIRSLPICVVDITTCHTIHSAHSPESYKVLLTVVYILRAKPSDQPRSIAIRR